MAISVSATREVIKDELERSFPEVNWLDGRLAPYMGSQSETYGAVSSVNEVQVEGQLYTARVILVQVFLAHTPTSNPTIAHVVDPKEIEDLATEIIDELQSVATDGQQWYFKPIRVDYPSDSNGQQTRAEIQFVSFDALEWL